MVYFLTILLSLYVHSQPLATIESLLHVAVISPHIYKSKTFTEIIVLFFFYHFLVFSWYWLDTEYSSNKFVSSLLGWTDDTSDSWFSLFTVFIAYFYFLNLPFLCNNMYRSQG